jgi:protein-tyrosine phosphatase
MIGAMSSSSAAGGFVDIHSHVLYGMDDGAKTREESLQILELAARSGTTHIVATPHANSRYRYDRAVIDAQIADLNATVQGIRVHRGCDFSLQATNIDDAIAHPNKYTINGLQYLLVEFPDAPILTHHDSVLEHLLGSGLTPIVTHPERNAAIRSAPNHIARWIDLGCYVQATAGSIVGRFGKGAREFTNMLISRGHVHFVASDAHDCRHRPPTLRPAYDALSSEWGEAAIRGMFVDNPRAVIRGETLDVPLAPVRRKRKWFQFWK